MFYVSRGSLPRQRHTQHRAADGALYAEELFGVEGFTGRSSLLYHLVPPTQTHKIEKVGPVKLEKADDGWHHHRLVNSAGLAARGDISEGRYPLFFNNDVVMGVARPAASMPDSIFYRNGDADEMLFVHEGSGTFESVFGNLTYGPGDYIVIPIGTTYRLNQDAGVDHRILYVESPSEIVARKVDYHPLAIPAPYNHSNINSDEVIYYVAGNFMSRRGVEISSFTVHPAGIPHGPHPGTVEASIGKEATEELAVMVDTFHPLWLTKEAAALEDANYPYSWLPPEDSAE